MKYLKLFENMDINPFDEENWDEEEGGDVLNIIKAKGGDNIVYMVVYAVEEGKFNMAYFDPKDKEFIRNENFFIEEKVMLDMTDDEINKIKNDEVDLSIFYFDYDKDEVDWIKYPYSYVIKLMGVDEISFRKN